MAVSGLVVTLSKDAEGSAALSRLTADSRLTLGERFGLRIAMVAETPSAHEDRSLFDELRGTPGIVHVAVAYVHLDPEPTTGAPPEPEEPVEYPHARR